ncbi:3-carboxy-cis,cis-muconate cycloisomerase [Rudanella lutea]|uniref:3-carboxy-cis,cis-muconate cycloisomerase n=1 Tax=Rudanella lutea TaxID=451374 RepID=UPI000379534E|nr:3-carboxy-cis,cis-muconate cycloisomerase [Rudanella lutea]
MSLYSGLFYSSEVEPMVSPEAMLGRMLAFEGALAQAQAQHELVPEPMAQIIADCCAHPLLDLSKLQADIALGGNAAIPLVKQLTAQVRSQSEEAARYVHLGATSQDVVDTATVLTIKTFSDWLTTRLTAVEEQLIRLTRTYRTTVMPGRTLLQQAKPITFGLKTAGWLDALRRSWQRLAEGQKRVLVLQLAGAVGSRNASIPAEVHRTMATQLDLSESVSWHTHRDNLAEFGATLGILTGSLGKIARDIALLMQTEVAEVFEGKAEGKGGSSTMPHKRNPVTCTAILANANRVPQLVATLLAAMPQEHERSAGLWHSEWDVLTEIMQLTAGAVDKGLDLLTNLDVDPDRMRQNLEQTNGLIYAETVSLALAAHLGKAEAHAQVEEASRVAVTEKRHLKAVLARMNLPLTNLDALFDPVNSLGETLALIDSILAGS